MNRTGVRCCCMILLILLLVIVVAIFIYNNSCGPTVEGQVSKSSDDDPRADSYYGEDRSLYMLKSKMVPPVCPKCPNLVQTKSKNCRPCPPCARCPEPSFQCKKVPNYNVSNLNILPLPMDERFNNGNGVSEYVGEGLSNSPDFSKYKNFSAE
jgi:hypothetical protein